MGLNPQELEALEGAVQRSRNYRDNELLVHQDAAFKAVYAVRSGMFKSTGIDRAGNERIINFHLPGELIGLDAIYSQRYQASVTALDTASACLVPYTSLTELAARIPSLQQQLLRLLSKEINTASALGTDVPVEQRLAQFLWNLSQRYQQRGYSSSRFSLSMPRRDLANHLNMAPETISRMFKRLQESGALSLQRRELVVEDMNKLKQLAGVQG